MRRKILAAFPEEVQPLIVFVADIGTVCSVPFDRQIASAQNPRQVYANGRARRSKGACGQIDEIIGQGVEKFESDRARGGKSLCSARYGPLATSMRSIVSGISMCKSA